MAVERIAFLSVKNDPNSEEQRDVFYIFDVIFSPFLWLWVPFLTVDKFVYFYLGVGRSSSRALSIHLFVRLQGQLDVARSLGLLLCIDLRGQRVRGQQD